MNSILSNPLFVAGFNALDHAGPIAQLGVAAVVVAAVAWGAGALATGLYNLSIHKVDKVRAVRMIPAE